MCACVWSVGCGGVSVYRLSALLWVGRCIACACVYVCLRVCVCVCVCLRVCTYMNVYVYIKVYAYINVCVCVDCGAWGG